MESTRQLDKSTWSWYRYLTGIYRGDGAYSDPFDRSYTHI